MAYFEINTVTLKKIKDELSLLARYADEHLSEAYGSLALLNTSFSTSADAEIIKRLDSTKSDTGNALNALCGHIEKLDEIIASYEEAERRNTNAGESVPAG